MDQKPIRLILAALALGWLFDFLFWGQMAGVNFTLFYLALPAAAYPLLRGAGITPARKSLLLLVPLVFFSAAIFIRRESLSFFLALSVSAATLGHYFITYRGGRWLHYGLFDLVERQTRLGISVLFGGIGFVGRSAGNLRLSREGTARLPYLQVLRGLLLAVPLLILLGGLLISADAVFHQRMYEFGQLFRIENLGEYAVRLILVCWIGYSAAGLWLNVETARPDDELRGEDEDVIKPLIGMIEAGTVLGSVILLFTVFVVIQFQYLFGGEANIGIEGYTYSEYARRGFNEILIVAFISLVLMIGLSGLTRRTTDLARRIFTGLTTGLGALVLVMLASAYMRLELAIQWHGFSRLRFYPRIFLFWLALLIAAVVVLVIRRRQRFFTTAAILAAYGFAVSIVLLNVDASIVHYNVFRARQGKHFNVTHLALLSTDAVPALAEEFMKEEIPPRIHEAIGAALLCHLERWDEDPPRDWPSYNLSLERVLDVLEAHGDALAEYEIKQIRSIEQVVTPGGVAYQCWAPVGRY